MRLCDVVLSLHVWRMFVGSYPDSWHCSSPYILQSLNFADGIYLVFMIMLEHNMFYFKMHGNAFNFALAEVKSSK